MLLYLDPRAFLELAKARAKGGAGPGQLSMFGGGAPGQAPAPTQAAKHLETVRVAAHERHTDHGTVEVPSHTRLVMVANATPHPEHVAAAREAFEEMSRHEDDDLAHAEGGRKVNHPARARSRELGNAARERFEAFPRHVQDAAVAASVAPPSPPQTEAERSKAWTADMERRHAQTMADRVKPDPRVPAARDAFERIQDAQADEDALMRAGKPDTHHEVVKTRAELAAAHGAFNAHPSEVRDAAIRESVRSKAVPMTSPAPKPAAALGAESHTAAAEKHQAAAAALKAQWKAGERGGQAGMAPWGPHDRAALAHAKAATMHRAAERAGDTKRSNEAQSYSRTAEEASRIAHEQTPTLAKPTAASSEPSADWGAGKPKREKGDPMLRTGRKVPKGPTSRGGDVAPAPVSPPAQPTPSAGFPHAFGAAFDQLRKERGANLVTLASLRDAMPGVSRADFDRELTDLRRSNQFVLAPAEGRHRKPAPEETAAGIVEGDRRFVYVSRREA